MNDGYTFISDLNQGQPQQPQLDYSTLGQQQQQQQYQSFLPQTAPIDMYKKYLDDSDSDDDSDEELEESSHNSNNIWQHVYSIVILVLLIVILFYVFRIRRELVGMYEEA